MHGLSLKMEQLMEMNRHKLTELQDSHNANALLQLYTHNLQVELDTMQKMHDTSRDLIKGMLESHCKTPEYN